MDNYKIELNISEWLDVVIALEKSLDIARASRSHNVEQEKDNAKINQDIQLIKMILIKINSQLNKLTQI